MKMFFFTIQKNLEKGVDILDITNELNKLIQKININQGTINLTAIGSTASLTTIEYEPGVVQDLKNTINKIASPDQYYEHEKTWHDGNGHSHVQAALLGPSLCLPIRNNQLELGTWQQVVIINHDIKPRVRKIEVTIIGI